MEKSSTTMNWRNIIVPPDLPIIKMLEVINSGSLKAAVVAKENNEFLGVVTDGDVRRAILNGISMNDPVKKMMPEKCIVASPKDSEENIIYLMQRSGISHLPIIDSEGRIVDLKILIHMLTPSSIDNWVILMAGGIGKRLKPLTENCPKPMLEIGGRPILHTIINNLKSYGLRYFVLSVNYKAEMIKEYLGDGSKFGVEIRYIHEKEKLGTAGSLSLLNEKPEKPFIVMNSDLLTNVDFLKLLEFHNHNNSLGTMCVREYYLEIPYGVVIAEGHKLRKIDEKPMHKFFVNAGIYVFDPRILELVPQNKYFDMNELFEKILNKEKNANIFPIHEFWLDIGKRKDFDRALNEYSEYFQK